jgi:hypothetical protein
MSAIRSQTAKLVLLLALVMPLPGFMSAWSCDASAAVTAGSAGQEHCTHQTAAPLHHGCGMCCSVAATGVMPLPWTAPHAARAAVLLPSRWPPLNVVLDRLDRPPRHA